MSAEAPSALFVRPSLPLPDLPRTLDQLKPPFHRTESGVEPKKPITLFLTVDVEDSYFDRPILMSGDGIGREFGVFGILDEFDSLALKGTFFVNVYEKDRQPAGEVEQVVREIAARGHEVGLHTHPSPTLDFYRRPLFRLSLPAQVEVLRWGVDLIEKWTGERPTSFRAGGYALNDDTLVALQEVGIAIDSSCFFPSPNNHNTRRTVNAAVAAGGPIEVPITTVLRTDGGDEFAHRKLDLDWLLPDELSETLNVLAHHGADFAMFMMHSFSFIDKRTWMPDHPPSPRARFVSEVDFDRYVEVYGPKPAMRRSLSTFLEKVSGDPSIMVRTLREARPALARASGSPDIVPIVRAQAESRTSPRNRGVGLRQ